MDDRTLVALVQSLTLREKAALCSGADAWHTKPNAARGIPSLFMADGPHGLRVEDKRHEKQNGGASVPATCFPPAVASACSWDTALLRRVGEALAAECRAAGVGLLLGPGVNIKRSPLGGRNFEYFSEDPLLAGEMGAALIQGVQSGGVGTCLKHYAVNNQETQRMSISAAVDERALMDIYLKPFQIAVQKAKPASVMCSYNRVNGVYASEHRRLLTDILRLRFGFAGAVVSDWGAVNDRAAGVAAGLDLEMPSSGGANDYRIEEAVQGGLLSEDALDAACLNVLRLVFRCHKPKRGAGTAVDWAAHHALAVEAAAQSAVLLKNDGLLPWDAEDDVPLAVIGELAEKPRYQGGGSSVMNPKCLVSFTAALKAQGVPFQYAAGYCGTGAAHGQLEQAVQTAKKAGRVVLFLGLPDAYECEGYDRSHLRLPESQLALIDALAETGVPLCAVLCCGGPVETPWLDKVQALLCPHLGGEGVGEAVYRLLFGLQNPAGRLAESWPLALEDTPSHRHFPMGPNEVTYNESIFVGYRYYDTAEKPVRFPFGYGLCYTSFSVAGLKLVSSGFVRGADVTVQCSVTNEGTRAGSEVVQVYLARKNSTRMQPAHELVAFTKVLLGAGETQDVLLTIPYARFGYWDAETASHVVEAGEYEIAVGHHSRALPLRLTFTLEGQAPPAQKNPLPHSYRAVQGNAFPTEDFKRLYRRKLLGNTPPQKGEYTPQTPLGLMQGSLAGRGVRTVARFAGRRFIRFSADREANRCAANAMADDLPFKNIVIQTWGLISPAAAAALLRVCNGRGGVLRFVRLLLTKPPYRRKRR